MLHQQHLAHFFHSPGPVAACFGLAGPGTALLATPAATTHLPAAELDLLDDLTHPNRSPATPYSASGHLLILPYALGQAIEPATAPPTTARPAAATTRITIQRIDSGSIVRLAPDPTSQSCASPTAGFSVGPLRSRPGRAAYRAAVVRALEYIRAGDIYQVNLGHELAARFDGCPRSFFTALAAAAAPAHGAYAEWDEPAPASPLPQPGSITTARTALCSMSPELFLRFDAATRTLITRPMKGTRPATASTSELAAAPKDRAELAMIVDLMRNDLGRIAQTGTVRVDSAHDIERHAGSVLQATATISCRVRPGVGLAGILRATFPAGSITGAPKIRAMQIINELEPFDRDLWCGAIGFLCDDGSFALNVAIRTATIRGPVDPAAPSRLLNARLHYPAGAGIVADSLPEAEWRETLLKARVLRTALRRPDPPTPPPQLHPPTA